MEPESFSVPVQGGDLAVARWGHGPTPIVLIHGITGTSRHFSLLAEKIQEAVGQDISIIAPDLRGRGDSRHLVGPFGMAAHAADVVAVLDHLGIDDAVILGHSMGGFVLAVLALRYPERVRHAVLVDGGIALNVQLPPGVPVDAVLKMVIGPAMDRLAMTFDSPEAYLDYWRPHPALAESDAWDPWLEDALRYDLWFDEQAGTWRPTSAIEQIRGDGRDTLVEAETKTAAFNFKVPASFLWCPRGIMNQAPGLYPPDAVASFPERIDGLTVLEIPDTNHYTMVISHQGAKAIAAHLATLL